MTHKMSNKTSFAPPANQFKLLQTSNRSNYKPKSCHKLRSFSRRFFGYLCPSCCGASKFKHNMRAGHRKRSRIKTICGPPWNCFPFCCCSMGRQHRATDSSEDICNLIRNCGTANGDDIDIDQYVARYRQSEPSQLPATSTTTTTLQGHFAMATNTQRTPTAPQATTPEVHKRGKKKKLMKHIWNWNDSLKSNSDKFLESLEYDAVHGNGGGSKSNSLKKYRKITNCSNIEGTFFCFL